MCTDEGAPNGFVVRAGERAFPLQSRVFSNAPRELKMFDRQFRAPRFWQL